MREAMTLGTFSSMSIPCFNCGADMIHDYGTDVCPDCGATEIASIHDHGIMRVDIDPAACY